MNSKILKYSLFLLVAIMSTACATYKTVNPKSQIELIQYVESLDNEKCTTIPRVYSGVYYTGCVLCNNVKLKSEHTDIATVPFDFIADTILLPYTIIRQITDGDIVLKKIMPSQN